MVNDFVVYVRRDNAICKCVHFEWEHTFEGTKCRICECAGFDISDMSGSTMTEILEAWNEVNE